ncbi:hypothetical protein SDC9_177932 [bioreactor metagenome]|uniref:ABC transporter domain-containing protein n=1 Tax=bioreactor metagenome TaxID=1076179 RepID=A0A645GUC5_9ZZZZ
MFMFRGDDVFKEVKVLSGGERARLTLAKLMQRKVNVLILDEPTNHLDINSREALESALGKFDGTVIAVSHDRYFINRLATHILEIIPETHSAIDFIGSYGEFTEKRSLLLPVSMSASGFDREPTASKESYLTMKKARAASSKRIRDTEKTSAEIKRAEERLDEIVRLCETEAASDYVRLTELYNEKSETEEKLLELYEFMDQLTQEQS